MRRLITLQETYRNHRALFLVALVLLLFSPFAMSRLFSRAEVADFYPATCLGSWENPHYAEGKPETFDSSDILITRENASVFAGVSDKIFCGNFIPNDYEPKGEIARAGLTLVWSINENTSFPVPSLDVAPVASSSEPEAAPTEEAPANEVPEKPKLDEGQGQNQTPAPPQEPALPVDEPPPVPSSTSLFGRLLFSSAFFIRANAQTPENQTTTEGIIPPSVEETPSPTAPAAIPEEAQSVPAPAEPLPENTDGGEVISPPIEVPGLDDRFLKISYSVDGESWSEVARVSSADMHNFTVALPISNWEELKKIQISVEGIPTSTSEIPKIFLDGMLVEVEYAVPPIFQGEEIVIPAEENTPAPSVITLPENKRPFPAESQSSDFGSNETPLFQMNLDDLPLPVPASTPAATSTPPTSLSPPPPTVIFSPHRGGFFYSLGRAFLSFFGTRHNAHAEAVPSGLPTLQNPVVAKIIGPDGKDTDFEPSFLTINNQLRISVPEPQKPFVPGRYRLELFIFKNNTVYFTENNFTWGVLAVNFDKSIYTKKDTAHIGLAVLTDQGHTICDAELTLAVVSPSGERTRLSTQNGKVKRSSSCGPETITNEPDYSSEIKASEIGEYAVTVIAETANGTRQITDKFRVESAPAFDVRREGPTRIFPPATYKVSLHVTAAADFTGDIVEHIPESFQTITENNSRVDVQNGIKNITWSSVALTKGKEREFVYFFKAPDVSPELYKLGPLRIGNPSTGLGRSVFMEARSWQVAADAAGDIILLWEGNNIPSGWTCISCVATDSFFNVFPRASSTYGSASTSQDTAFHNFTGASDGGAMTTANNMGNGAIMVVQTDTHTWGNGTSTSDSILPPYKELKLISASSPVTQLPNGAIGIFDVAATSSLPANWSYYSAMNGNYLRGANTTSTSGSATHSHTVLSTITSGNSSAGGSSSNKSAAVASAHTHSISTSATTTLDNNAPSFIPVVFAQLATTSSIPDGLIAMFDNTSLPTDWNIISTSGSAYAGNLLKGANALGSAGGATTHNHGGTRTWISSTGGTLSSDTGTNGGTANAAGGHSHSVTYTVTPGNSMPVYRDIILGKYTAPVANSGPTVSAVVLNGGGVINLTENTTKAIAVVASTTDPDGAGDIRFATGTLYRSGIAGTKNCAADNLNCYQIASSGCNFTDTTSTVSCSANVWHFAQATDASSSFSAQNWLGSITVTDSVSNNTNSTTASGVELNTLLAIDVTPATISYGTRTPGTNTGSTNATTSVKNAGNSSSTLKLNGTALTLLSNFIPTSSQHYATSSFTYNTGEQELSEASSSVSGFLLTSPTSTTAVSTLMYWGIAIPTGRATGTYSGTNVYTGVFSP